jgi:hypothetical protein
VAECCFAVYIWGHPRPRSATLDTLRKKEIAGGCLGCRFALRSVPCLLPLVGRSLAAPLRWGLRWLSWRVCSLGLGFRWFVRRLVRFLLGCVSVRSRLSRLQSVLLLLLLVSSSVLVPSASFVSAGGVGGCRFRACLLQWLCGFR